MSNIRKINKWVKVSHKWMWHHWNTTKQKAGVRKYFRTQDIQTVNQSFISRNKPNRYTNKYTPKVMCKNVYNCNIHRSPNGDDTNS